MKKNTKIIISILIILITLSFIIFSPTYKIIKGYILFGNEKCKKNEDSYSKYEDNEHPLYGGDMMTPWHCAICGKKNTYPNTSIPKLCDECAQITNRCKYCGKLKEN